jgi:hypothetical protein
MIYIQGKGYFDTSGRKVASKRQMDLRLARAYGAAGDSDSFTRLYCESKVSTSLLNAEYRHGAAMARAKAMEALK